MIKIEHPIRFSVFLLFLGMALIVPLWLLVLFFWWDSSLNQSGEFTVNEGMSAREVWFGLARQGFTGSPWPWRYHAWRLDAAAKVKPGTYQLQAGDTIASVIQKLVEGDESSRELTLTFPEGFTLAQMAERIAAAGLGEVADFRDAANPAGYLANFPFLQGVPPGRDLEGYLFPDTYRVFKDDKPADIIKRQLGNFDLKVTADLRQEALAAGRSLDQIIIMASIVEREVISDEDMAKVAGVLWSRYDDGVGLDADATVRYALNKWTQPLTIQDLASDSPYNTRKWKGLPPGPISNPGLRALVATVRPQKTDYYYYLSAPSGETIFSKTLDEHNANKAKYLQ